MSDILREGYGSPGKSGNILVAINAKHNVPSKKANAIVFSLISHLLFRLFAIDIDEQPWYLSFSFLLYYIQGQSSFYMILKSMSC